MQLFSAASAQELLERCQYTQVSARAFVNSYALRYWMRLAPLPGPAKRGLSSAVNGLGLGDMKLSFNVGNTVTSGLKPLH